jgi:hypothetical protein
MAGNTQLLILEEEERRAPTRLASYRAKLYRHDATSPMAVEMRLRELERKWKGAAHRLQRAHRASEK